MSASNTHPPRLRMADISTLLISVFLSSLIGGVWSQPTAIVGVGFTSTQNDAVYQCDEVAGTSVTSLSNCAAYPRGFITLLFYTDAAFGTDPTTYSINSGLCTGALTLDDTIPGFSCTMAAGVSSSGVTPVITCSGGDCATTPTLSGAGAGVTVAGAVSNSAGGVSLSASAYCESDGAGGLMNCPSWPALVSGVVVTITGSGFTDTTNVAGNYNGLIAAYVYHGTGTTSTYWSGTYPSLCCTTCANLPTVVDSATITCTLMSSFASSADGYRVVTRNGLITKASPVKINRFTTVASAVTLVAGTSGCNQASTTSLTNCPSPTTVSAGATISFSGTNFGPSDASTYYPVTINLASAYPFYSVCSSDLTIASATSAYCTFKGIAPSSSASNIRLITYGSTSATSTYYSAPSTGLTVAGAAAPSITNFAIVSTGGGYILCGSTSSTGFAGTSGSPVAYTNCPYNALDSNGAALQVSITGSNFISGSMTVSFCSDTPVVTSTTLTCTLTAKSTSSSTQTISTLTISNGQSTTLTGSITYAAIPTVTGVNGPSPCTNNALISGTQYTTATGCPTGGTGTLTIYGTNFYGARGANNNLVSAQGCSDTPVITSSTTATCTLASGTTTVNLQVVANGGTSATQSTYYIQYNPTVTNFAIVSTGGGYILCGSSSSTGFAGTSGNPVAYTNCPYNALDSNGAALQVSITGSNFISGSMTVSFCSDTPVVTSTTLTCTLTAKSPSSSTQTISTLTVSNGQSTTITGSITYAAIPTVTGVNGPSPCTNNALISGTQYTTTTGCSTSGGGTLTIYGTNFYGAQGANNYLASAQGCSDTPVITSSTTATCTLASGTTQVNLKVTANGGSSATQTTYNIQYTLGPTVTGFTISSTSSGTVYCSQSSSNVYTGCPVSAADSNGVTLQVSITGSNFASGATSTICSGGYDYTNVPTGFTCSLPSQTPASSAPAISSVSVTSGGVTGSLSGASITYVGQPTVNGVNGPSPCSNTNLISGTRYTSASSCSINGGGTITIYGTNFVGKLTSSACNGGVASIQASTYATCTLASGSGQLNLAVASLGGDSASQSTYFVSYAAAPVISTLFIQSTTSSSIYCGGSGGSSVSYTNCPINAQDASGAALQVSIHGSNFGTGATVSICSGSYTYTGTTDIVCNLASQTASASTITISSLSVSINSQTGVVSGSVTFAPLPTITGVIGPTASSCTNSQGDSTVTNNAVTGCAASGSGTLTIYGTNFYGKVSSSLCNGAVTIGSGYATCTLVAGSGTVTVAVTSVGGSSTTTGFSVAYAAQPTVTSITHTSCTSSSSLILTNCPVGGVGTLTISGSGLTGASSVSLCVAGTVTASANTITCTLISGSAAATSQLSFTSLGGSFTASSSCQVTFVSAPTLTGLSSSLCTGTTNVVGCSSSNSGNVVLSFSGSGFFSTSDSAISTNKPQVCSGALTYQNSGLATCILQTGSSYIGTSVTGITITSFGVTSSASFSLSYITNAFTAGPTLYSNSLTTTSIPISLTSAASGTAYVYVLGFGSTQPALSTIRAGTSALCFASASVTASSSTTVSATCGSALGTSTSTAKIDIYVYVDSASATNYGTLATLSSQNICHSDCATCNAAVNSAGNNAGTCTSCASGLNLANNYCCASSCATCSVPSGQTTAQSQNACLQCPSGYRKYGMLLGAASANTISGQCCYQACWTCSGPAANQCTACPGRNHLGGDGHCYGGPSQSTMDSSGEIHGDPHFKGFRGQEYTISGYPGAVYNIITEPKLQYNTRFVWYGDVYHGVDPTDKSRYDANVTYIGEVAMKFKSSNGEEHRLFFDAHTGNVTMDGVILAKDRTSHQYVDNTVTIVNSEKKIEILNNRFEWIFYIAGSKSKPYINEEVRVLKWSGIEQCHGLLGQTWKQTPADSMIKYDRNTQWREHVPGEDFQFKQSYFLEGHLQDYRIQSGDVWGDDFHFNKYSN